MREDSSKRQHMDVPHILSACRLPQGATDSTLVEFEALTQRFGPFCAKPLHRRGAPDGGGFTGCLTPAKALRRATYPRDHDLCPLLRPYQLCLNRARVRDGFGPRNSAVADTFGHGTGGWLAPSPQSSSPDGMPKALANAERLMAPFPVPDQVAYASDGNPPQPLAASCKK